MVTCDLDRDVSTAYYSLLQAVRSTGYASPYKALCSAVIGYMVFNSCDWRISLLSILVNCSHGGPLSYGSPVLVFLDRGHLCFWNFYFTVPVDVVRLKFCVNHLFEPTCVTMRITINKLYFIPKRVVSVVSVCEFILLVFLFYFFFLAGPLS